MALCCIGGVCVPYTAVVPILLMALRWFVGKLAEFGLLPKSVVNFLGTSTGTSTSTGTGTVSSTDSCCASASNSNNNNSNSSTCSSSSSSGVMVVESVQQFNALLHEQVSMANGTVVIKFTATWCMPCKKIAPVYHELAEMYDALFTQVNVDDVDLGRVVGAQFKVTCMPTFCIVSTMVDGGKDNGENNNELSTPTTTVVKMSGSDERKLRSFMADHLKRRKMD